MAPFAKQKMPRFQRLFRPYANPIIFCSLISLIFVFHFHDLFSSERVHDFTTVRYQSRRLPLPAHGACPGLPSRKPALVIARTSKDGDIAWSRELANKYHLCIYTVDGPRDAAVTQLQVPKNKGHEAMAYLTFIIDNYETLGPAAVFVHGSRYAWHNDAATYDNLKILQSLNVSAAQAYGYHNLRCDWSTSTCAADARPHRSMEVLISASLQPHDLRLVSDAALPLALSAIFGDKDHTIELQRQDVIRAQCCAQFIVSRDRIYQHSQKEYLALRNWLLESAPRQDRVSGRILSYVWHILFSKASHAPVRLADLNAESCPSAADCYCTLYGRCGLSGCTSDRCPGQYSVPYDGIKPGP